MKKKLLTVILFSFITAILFSQSITFQLDGNAHVLSYNNLSELHQMKESGKLKRFSTERLHDFYYKIYKENNDNALMKEQKQKEAQNSVIVIYGFVNLVRKSILDEYIVELQGQGQWSSMSVSVVFPKRISPAMLNELMQLKKGDYFESIAFTRTSSAYVDVPVWNSNGIYRTEP